MLIKIKTTSLLSFKLRNPGKYKYTRHGVEGIYQTRCIEPTLIVCFYWMFACVHCSYIFRMNDQGRYDRCFPVNTKYSCACSINFLGHFSCGTCLSYSVCRYVVAGRRYTGTMIFFLEFSCSY